jgi:uncharacterized membrane protein YtjA (UPF0391 family)
VGNVLRLAHPGADCPSPADRAQWPLAGCDRFSSSTQGAVMLYYAVVFFVIALIAAFFGFGGIAVGAAGIAKILFVVFLIGAVISFLMSLGRRV